MRYNNFQFWYRNDIRCMTCFDSYTNLHCGYLGFNDKMPEFGKTFFVIDGNSIQHCSNPQPENSTHDSRWWFFIPSETQLDNLIEKLKYYADKMNAPGMTYNPKFGGFKFL